MTTPHHQAQNLFLDDVRDTYNRIKTRTAELAAKRSAEDAAGGVEQIQLHAVDPNTQIHITVPPPVGQLSDASAPGPTEDQLRARALFETFPPGLQRALEGGNLDHVNKVLAKMSVEEAEEIVDKMGQGNMLNLEEGVIDATTEEGQKVVEEIERTKKMPHSSEGTPVLDEEPSHD